MEDIYAFGLKLVRQRWRTIGYPTEEMPPGVFPFDPEEAERGNRRRQVKLMLGGILGPADAVAPSPPPELKRLWFDVVDRAADPTRRQRLAARLPVAVHRRRALAPVIDNGSTRAEAGHALNPAVTLEASWADCLATTKPDANPLKMMLTASPAPPRQHPRDGPDAEGLRLVSDPPSPTQGRGRRIAGRGLELKFRG